MDMRQAAVCDIGSARAKLLTAEKNENGVIIYQKFSEETGLAKFNADEENTEVISDIQKRFKEDLLKLLKNVKNSSPILTIATEAVRNNIFLRHVLAELFSQLGEVYVLSPQKEAAIFYKSLQNKLGKDNLKNTVLVDIGGGSVQIIGENNQQLFMYSFPIGTYALEKLFNISGKPLNDDIIRAIEEHILTLIKDKISGVFKADKIIMGSNCMEDFMLSAFAKSGLNLVKKEAHIEVDAGDISALLSQLKGKSYDSLSDYYPANPKLMYGIDKSLIIVKVIADYFGCRTIIPTDESLSTALIAMQFDDMDNLKMFLNKD